MSPTQKEISEFDRATALLRTPEQISDDIRAQKEAGDRLRPLVTDSVAVANYKSAMGVIDAAVQKKVSPERLAEAQFWKGDFAEAALTLLLAVSANHEKRPEYIRFAEALERLGSEACDCASMQIPGGGSAKGQSVAAKREIQRVFVAALNKEVKFIYCERCKTLFAQSA